MAQTRRPRSRALVPLTAVAAVALLAGCAGASGSSASGSSSSTSAAGTSSSAGGGARQSPLSKGLLPAGAFGPQANVVSLTLQQLQQQQSTGALGAASGAQISPPQCADALKSTQPDTSQVQDLVAQSATVTPAGGAQGVLTVEVILRGGSASKAVGELRSVPTTCPQVTVTEGQSNAVVAFSPVDASSVGGTAAAVAYTTTLSEPGQPAVSVPALVGAAQDGDRLVLLLTADAKSPTAGQPAAAATPPDQSAFTALLKQACSTEKKALG